MKLIKLIVVAGLVLFCSMTAYAQSDKTIQLAVADSATGVINAYLQFLQKAYGEMGYEVKMIKYPLKRVYMVADTGKVDGILLAPGSILKSFKNLVIVEPPLAHIDLAVFTIDKEFEVAGPKSLAPYKIGILRGYPLSEKMTQGLDRQILNDYESLFKVLNIGRVDVALAMRREALRFLKDKPEFARIKDLKKPVIRLPLYTMLNKKHEALVPKVSPIMKRLMDEKVLLKLYAPYAIQNR